MQLRFDFVKSLQAAGVLLQLEDGRMPYIRLLKLLYIADRELLAETAASVTGDRACAMKKGPVLSHVYSLIKGESSRSQEWFESIETQGYAVKLKRDRGRGRLSRGEIEKLVEVSERHRNQDHWEISDLTHDFPEWRQHFPEGACSGSYAIPWQDILRAQGKEEMILAVEVEEAARRHLDEVFGE